MKYFKIFALALIAMNALFFAAPLFMDKNFDVSRSHTFQAQSAEAAFELLGDFKNHHIWNPWFQADSSMKTFMSTPSRGLGAYYTWESEESGKGKQLITKFIPTKEIQTDFDFGEMGQAQASWIFETKGDLLTITWRFWGPANGYVGRYMAHFMDSMMSPMMTHGFEKLAQVLSDDQALQKLQPPQNQESSVVQNRSNPLDSLK